MEVKYRIDTDLDFLGQIPDKYLEPLVMCMTHDGKNIRLTSSLVTSDKYKKYKPRHSKYWKEVAGELQTYGANTIATMFRGGEGIPYKELLIEACESAKVNFNKDSTVEVIEGSLLQKVFENSLEKLTPKELQELVKIMDLKTTNFTQQGVTMALQTAIRMGGFNSYKLALVFANTALNAVGGKLLIGGSARFALNRGLMKGMAKFAGPIGWAITAIWTTYDIAGPAKRVTVPACIHIAYLRQMHMNGDIKISIWRRFFN